MTMTQSASIAPNRRPVRLALFLAALATLVGAPARQAEAKLFKPSAQEQKRLGAEAAREIEKKHRVVGGERQRRVERVGRRLVAALPQGDRAKWDYRFRVLSDKEVNAFALPGGPVYINTGLLDRLRTDDALAAVMAHEIAHVRKEHWARMSADSQTRGLGLLAILSVTKADRGWYDAAGIANGLADLRYSRKDEDQADEAGLQNMAAAGYNPRGMVDLFRTLQSAGGDRGTPEFLRSHPNTGDRIRKTQDRIAKMR